MHIALLITHKMTNKQVVKELDEGPHRQWHTQDFILGYKFHWCGKLLWDYIFSRLSHLLYCLFEVQWMAIWGLIPSWVFPCTSQGILNRKI